MVLLSKLEETLVIEGVAFDLSTNQYPGAIHPKGYMRQIEFRLDPYPVSLFRVGDVVLEKSVFMPHGENAPVIRYRLASGARPGVRLELRPLIAFRDYHSLTQANPVLNPTVHSGDAWYAVEPYGAPGPVARPPARRGARDNFGDLRRRPNPRPQGLHRAGLERCRVAARGRRRPEAPREMTSPQRRRS